MSMVRQRTHRYISINSYLKVIAQGQRHLLGMKERKLNKIKTFFKVATAE